MKNIQMIFVIKNVFQSPIWHILSTWHYVDKNWA